MRPTEPIRLAIFDDSSPPVEVAPATRPADRPRVAGAPPGSLTLFAFDDTPQSATAAPDGQCPTAAGRDVAMIDPQTGAFLVLFPASPGRQARTRAVRMPTHHKSTEITLHSRKAGGPDFAPFVSFRFKDDLSGRVVRFRFADPSDIGSIAAESDEFDVPERITLDV